MNSSHNTSASYRADRVTASCICAWLCTLVTPMEEPSRGGLTISGRPNTSGTLRTCAASSWSAARRTYLGVGSPSACQMRLVMTLSMATLEAITPEPVYGIPSSSSAPCTVPSSPWRPCNAMKQRVKPSSRSAPRSRCAGSNGWASTPLSRRACSTPAPDMSDTSRSADAPPISTATLPKF